MNCLVCEEKLEVSLCKGKKERKAIMLSCPKDGRHFRAFINEQSVVDKVAKLGISLEDISKGKSNSLKEVQRLKCESK